MAEKIIEEESKKIEKLVEKKVKNMTIQQKIDRCEELERKRTRLEKVNKALSYSETLEWGSVRMDRHIHYGKLRKKQKRRGFIIVLIAGICLIFAIFFYSKHQNGDQKITPETKQAEESTLAKEEFEMQQRTISLDMNSDGKKETVTMHESDFTVTPPLLGYVTIHNSKGEKIARNSEWLGSVPHPIRMTNHNLNKSEKKEYLRMEFIAGPHQFESMFFTLNNNELIPICKSQQPQSVADCLFYITQDSLIVADIDGDGFSEVCEIASVYPSSEELNDEEKKAIDEVFEEEAEDAKEIVGNEQGQRVAVVWGIYSFNGKYFEPQTGEVYDRLFELLTKDSPFSPMKKSEMSQSEIEHTERVRNFWNHR